MATDGAPSMIGKYSGVVSCLKKDNPSLFSIHCIVHRQHLVAKELSVKLNHSLNIIIRTVNKIKRSFSNVEVAYQRECFQNYVMTMTRHIIMFWCTPKSDGCQKELLSKVS